MRDSTPPNQRSTSSESDPGHDVPEDLPQDMKDLDQALGRLLSPLADQAPDGLSDRVFEASVEQLPTKVLPFESPADPGLRRVRIPYVGYAALILVGILTFIWQLQPNQDSSTPERLAGRDSTTTMIAFEIEEPRESEAMLMAVLDPSEDWFEDDQDFGDQFVTGVGAVLQTRGFGVDDLSGDVLAMLGGSAS